MNTKMEQVEFDVIIIWLQLALIRTDDSWPEILQKLAIEQAKIRQKLIMDHSFERERLFEYGEKEYLRLLKNSQLKNVNKEINISKIF